MTNDFKQFAKCPWYIHYNENEEFDDIQKLADHLLTHESRFIARELAEKIFKEEMFKPTPWTHRERIDDVKPMRIKIGDGPVEISPDDPINANEPRLLGKQEDYEKFED